MWVELNSHRGLAGAALIGVQDGLLCSLGKDCTDTNELAAVELRVARKFTEAHLLRLICGHGVSVRPEQKHQRTNKHVASHITSAPGIALCSSSCSCSADHSTSR